MPQDVEILFRPIGVVHTANKQPDGTPIQSIFGEGLGRAEVFDEFKEGLEDLDGFSHIILLYAFHQLKSHKLKVVPFMDVQERGIFSTRSPARPNPIGISVVELVSVEDNIVIFKNPDMINGTPLLDIKPYVPELDSLTAHRIGWLEGRIGSRKKADDRFVEP